MANVRELYLYHTWMLWVCFYETFWGGNFSWNQRSNILKLRQSFAFSNDNKEPLLSLNALVRLDQTSVWQGSQFNSNRVIWEWLIHSPKVPLTWEKSSTHLNFDCHYLYSSWWHMIQLGSLSTEDALLDPGGLDQKRIMIRRNKLRKPRNCQ